ncbi:undecaprenyl-diphosphatase [Ilumatobacter fluminis]|uniref:Undecaprenyl-diphosphatase n=1 Tax=Ilumatobacter fluminis TaxID=467091 RepID=A0A4R7HWZ4_9ACTN|nr:undecaprenyl-diphosphate phosphatase [Ilumatobacter fluminis]TDT15525.1 undecaprenyl-diphosphatase [Ilumatobacter fluminis]
MPWYQAFVLGLVQGFSEFLPISSSGHLLLTRWVFGWDPPGDESVEKAFDVALHFGTFMAVVAYFRHDLKRYIREGVRLIWNREKPIDPDGRIAWLLVVATIPAALVGVVLEDWIDERLGTPAIIGVSLIVFGVLLWWADQKHGKRTIDEFHLKDSLIVGAAQTLALNPGTSRSGITMTAARWIGFDRDTAARVSFLLSLPVILGAVVFKVGGLFADGVPDGLGGALVIGVITSAISGWVAVWGTLALVRNFSFTPFVVYRIVVGVAVLIAVAFGAG